MGYVEPPRPVTGDTTYVEGSNPWDVGQLGLPMPTPPDVPGGADTPGEGVHVINVDAIKTYANNLEALLPVITVALIQLDDLQATGFGPGNLGAGNNLKGLYLGGSGQEGAVAFVPAIRTVYTEAETIIKEVIARCREIAQKYTTEHDLSELDAEEFGNMVSGVQAKVDNLTLGTTG